VRGRHQEYIIATPPTNQEVLTNSALEVPEENHLCAIRAMYSSHIKTKEVTSQEVAPHLEAFSLQWKAAILEVRLEMPEATRFGSS
jgi:hypothetical protein